MRKGYMVHLEAGLLGEDTTTEVTVVDGDSILEEVAAGNEDIIPDGYTEIDGEMTVTENLTDAIEEEELIIEEVERPMVEAGAESDFNAYSLKLLGTSNRRLNMMMGVDEKRGAPVAALESDTYGGYKKAFEAGLEAKENFLKNLKTKAASAWKALLDTIKKWIQKAVIFFNGAEKSATKIGEILNKKDKLIDEKDKLNDNDKKSLAFKFGAWLSIGGKIENYANYAEMLSDPAVPEAGRKIPLRDAGIGALPSAAAKSLGLADRDQFSILGLSGETGKFLVLKQELKSAGGNNRVNYVDLALDAKEISGIEIKSFKFKVEVAAITETNIPAVDDLIKFTKTTYKLAKELKTAAGKNYDAAESFPKAIKSLKEDEAQKGAALERVGGIAMRCALENVSAYMTAMKTMLWYASTYAKRYADEKK